MKKKYILIIFTIFIAVLFVFKGSITGSTIFNKKPNIVLITIETLRNDHMSTYGYQRKTTPNIDKLAEDSVVFTNNIGVSGNSGASLVSLLTSKYPYENGIHDVLTPISLSEITLPKILKNEGYTTYGIVPFAFFSKMAETNYDKGFDFFLGTEVFGIGDAEMILRDSHEFALFEALIDKYNGVDEEKIVEGIIKEIIRDAGRVDKEIDVNEIKESEQLRNYLKFLFKSDNNEIEKDKPFFIWTHLYGAHTPHFGHLDSFAHPDIISFFSMQITQQKGFDRITDPNNPSMKNNISQIPSWVKDILWGGKIPTDLDFFKALYDEDIYNTDLYIGDIIKKLKDEDLFDNTIIIITSDHGETLGEDGVFFIHGHSVKDYMIKLPLIIYYPEKLKHKVIDYQTSRLDLLPTILDLIGIKKDLDFGGKNLLKEKTEFIFIESMDCSKHLVPKDRCYPGGEEGRRKAVRYDNKYKLIMIPTEQGEIYELYDLEKDQGEVNNIYREDEEMSKLLKEKLDEWLVDYDKSKPIEKIELSKKGITETLKQLGYLPN